MMVQPAPASDVAPPLYKFSHSARRNPDWGDAQLLNSNNQRADSLDVDFDPTALPSFADVLVAGAGINGLIFAIHFKTIHPEATVVVIERSPSPAYKIGESTLSPFTRLCNTYGLKMGYMLRLFGIKDGLDFVCLDQAGRASSTQDVGGIDVSYQLERRVSELFLTMFAQRIGVRVYHGISADFAKSALEGASKRVHLQSAHRGIRRDVGSSGRGNGVRLPSSKSENDAADMLECSFVCDATGFSRQLTSLHGRKLNFPAFNTDAYWAYFREKPAHEAREFPFWDHPATKHVCFPEGWVWFIRLLSWQETPLPNLMDMIDYILDHAFARNDPDSMPSTVELARMFNCHFSWVVSIGWAVRSDVEVPEDLAEYGRTDAERKFKYFQLKQPLLDSLMSSHYELLERYYDGRTYFVHRNLAYQSPVVAGPGWLSVGNSSGFTNPLISPGINVGMAQSYFAAEVASRAFTTADLSYNEGMTNYQSFIEHMLKQLDRHNRLWYYCFRDPRVFERVIPVVLAFGIASEPDHYTHFFDKSDLNWVLGTFEDRWDEFFEEVFPLVEGPAAVPIGNQTLSDIEVICRRWIDHCLSAYPKSTWSAYFRHYDDRLQRVVEKHERTGALVALKKCSCGAWKPSVLLKCPICGGVRPRVPLIGKRNLSDFAEMRNQPDIVVA